MRKALVALIGLTISSPAWSHIKRACENHLLAGTDGLTMTRISETRLGEKNGWTISWHKTAGGETQLLALQKPTLLLKRIDPLTGKELEERSLSGRTNENDFVALKSTASGEALVLSTQNGSGNLALLSDKSDLKLNATLPKKIRKAELVTLNHGQDVFVVASTAETLHVLQRQEQKLVSVATIESPGLIRQMFVVAANERESWIVLHGLDHTVRLLKLKGGETPVREITEFTQLGGRIIPTQVDGKLALAIVDRFDRRTTVRFYTSEGNKISHAIEVDDVLGLPTSRLGTDGRARVLLPARRLGVSELLVIDPVIGRVDSALNLEGARQVHNLATIDADTKGLVVYSTEAQTGYIRGAKATKEIPASPSLKLKEVTTTEGSQGEKTLMAVLGEGPSGPKISVIELNK